MKMKTMPIAIIVSTVSGIAILMMILLFFTPNQITIKTDWSSYAGSEPISVSGEVNPVLPNEKILIEVFYQNGELYNSTTVSLIDNSNLYAYKFNIKPLGYGTADVFTIMATYNEKTASTSFEYKDNRSPGISLLPSSFQLSNNMKTLQKVLANSTSPLIYHRFYSASTPQLEYVLKRGQTMTVPVGIYYSERDAVHLTTYTHIHYCGLVSVQLPSTSDNPGYHVPNGCNLDPGDAMSNPADLSAGLDKKAIDLHATATNETTVRVTVNLVVSSSQDARIGVYRVTIGLTDDNEFHGGRMVYFKLD